MCGMLKKEFTVKKLSLNLEDSKILKESWILPLWVFMILRLTMALFCMVVTIVTGVQSDSPKLFIYLTIWSYILLTINFLGLSFLSLTHCIKQTRQSERGEPGESNQQFSDGATSEESENNPKKGNATEEEPQYIENEENINEQQAFHLKLIWFLWILSSAMALIVTLLYWTLVFRTPTSFIDISLHAINTFFVLIEIFMGVIPVHLLHGLYGMILASIYTVFTVIYWAAGGRYIYKPIDYEDGNPAVVAGTVLVSIFVIAPLMQLLLFLLYQLRCFLKRKISCCDSEGCSVGNYSLQTIGHVQ